MKAYLRTGLVCFVMTVLGVGRFLWQTGRTTADVPPLLWSFFILTPILATIVVGTFAAGAKVPWSWRRIILCSFGGWLLVFLLFVGVGGAYFLRQNQKAETSLDQLMTAHAGDAVERARTEFGVSLDYSPGSLVELEHLLERLHQRNVTNAFDQATLGRESRLWGAYIGGTFKKITAAEWRRNSEGAGEGSLPLKFKDGSECFPCTWAWKRIVNGNEDNVMYKFELELRALTKGLASVTNDPGVTVLSHE